jgi:serine protease inhibitor
LEPNKAVEHVNQFTEALLSTFDFSDNVVFSGSSIVVALATLLSGASGQAKQQLEAALDVPSHDAPELVARVMSICESVGGIRSATGLWVRSDIALHDAFVRSLPSVTVGQMPDSVELDRWADDCMGSMIDRLPGGVDTETLLLLASIVSAHSEWVQPFDETAWRWNGQSRLSRFLYRESPDLDSVALLSSNGSVVSRVLVEGKDGFDVHLLGGDDGMAPEHVIAVGCSALRNPDSVRLGSRLLPGEASGMLRCELVESTTHHCHVVVSLPAFKVQDQVDLLSVADRVGLSSAQDRTQGHFPGIADFPLAVSVALHQAKAEFHHLGFRAAAVTQVSLVAGGRPSTSEQVVISVEFHRPFGFLVVDRTTKLILFAGWVVHPSTESDDAKVLNYMTVK